MVSRSLVLGGGGPVGIAWEIGLAAGLAEAGLALARADRVIGTSAGSFVGASLVSGRRPEDLVNSQIEQAERERAARAEAKGEKRTAPDLTPLLRFMARRKPGEEPSRESLAEMGAFALNATTMPEESFVASFGAIAKDGAAWPKGFACTAVNALDGSFTTWDESSGVPTGRAIASSCSVPGVFPPITIKGRRYIDGGVRSATNADLAKGAGRVLLVAVMTNVSPEWARAGIDREIGVLRASGAEVRLIVPDEGCREVFGVNLMDGARRDEVVRAGVRQGRMEAEGLREFWS
jgi:NTE family protein